mgnify:FL=1
MINNPTGVAIHECKRIWPGRALDCVLSLGTGEPPPKTQSGGIKDTLLSVVESCCSVDRVDELLRVRRRRPSCAAATPLVAVCLRASDLQEFLDPSKYYRFNPRGKAFDCELDETNLEKIQAMASASAAWTEENLPRIEQLCATLR